MRMCGKGLRGRLRSLDGEIDWGNCRAGLFMISVRPFKEGDNQRLREIEGLCPQGNEKCAMGVRKTDILARYRMYDNWKVVVAEEDGIIAGWTGWTIKSDPVQEKRYAYLAEVMVHPGFRRKGVATKLVEEAERNAHEAECDHIYCLIYAPNDETNYASSTLFEGLGYSNVTEVKSCSLSLYKKENLSEDISLERIQKGKIDYAAGLINDHYSGYSHFWPYTAQSLEATIEKIPDYGLDNFWVAKDKGKVVACAGLWDCSAVAEFCYAIEPTSWKIMGMVFGFLGRFMKLPKIPKEGEYLHFEYLTHHAFDRQYPEAMQSLLGHLNNILLENGKGGLAAILDREDALFELMKKRQPQMETTFVFAKALKGTLPEFRPFYVDIRDMIF
jgi:N-acetylglutamate synthase-like GNAT family acetyltransferase